MFKRGMLKLNTLTLYHFSALSLNGDSFLQVCFQWSNFRVSNSHPFPYLMNKYPLPVYLTFPLSSRINIFEVHIYFSRFSSQMFHSDKKTLELNT